MLTTGTCVTLGTHKPGKCWTGFPPDLVEVGIRWEACVRTTLPELIYRPASRCGKIYRPARIESPTFCPVTSDFSPAFSWAMCRNNTSEREHTCRRPPPPSHCTPVVVLPLTLGEFLEVFVHLRCVVITLVQERHELWDRTVENLKIKKTGKVDVEMFASDWFEILRSRVEYWLIVKVW